MKIEGLQGFGKIFLAGIILAREQLFFFLLRLGQRELAP
jgi:hypothetical protein